MMGREGDFEKHQGNMMKQLWTRLDFAVPSVRDHIHDVIAEVAHNYDVDLIGMEFFKYWPFFRESMDGEPVKPEHVEMMNGLLRRIRRTADDVASRRGRPLLLAAHTPFGLDECLRIGVDLETWLQEGLIDQFSPGGTTESVFRDPYTDIIAPGHKYGIPVYPCLAWSFWVRWAFLGLSDGEYRDSSEWFETLYGGQPERAGKPSYIPALNGWEGTLPAWRGAAMNMFNAGADGLYIFNGAFGEPSWWREIGEVATMAGRDRLYGIDKFHGPDCFAAITEVELPVSTGLQVGEEVGSAGAQSIDLSLHLWNWVPGDDLSVRLNGEAVEGLQPADPERSPAEGQWIQGTLDARQVNRGPNQLDVTVRKRGESARAPVVMDTAQLRVRCEPA